jgi:hypothetical protein
MNRAKVWAALAVAMLAAGCAKKSGSCCDAGGGMLEPKGLAAARTAYFDAWTKSPGQTWTPAKLQAVLGSGEAFVSIDGMVPPAGVHGSPGPVFTDTKAFLAHWSGPGGMNAFTEAKLAEVRTIRTWGGGGLVGSVSEVNVSGTLPDGNRLSMPAYVTLVFTADAKSPTGWRLVHENMNLLK